MARETHTTGKLFLYQKSKTLNYNNGRFESTFRRERREKKRPKWHREEEKKRKKREEEEVKEEENRERALSFLSLLSFSFSSSFSSSRF